MALYFYTDCFKVSQLKKGGLVQIVKTVPLYNFPSTNTLKHLVPRSNWLWVVHKINTSYLIQQLFLPIGKKMGVVKERL